jgi:hypothetical protein
MAHVTECSHHSLFSEYSLSLQFHTSDCFRFLLSLPHSLPLSLSHSVKCASTEHEQRRGHAGCPMRKSIFPLLCAVFLPPSIPSSSIYFILHFPIHSFHILYDLYVCSSSRGPCAARQCPSPAHTCGSAAVCSWFSNTSDELTPTVQKRCC